MAAYYLMVPLIAAGTLECLAVSAESRSEDSQPEHGDQDHGSTPCGIPVNWNFRAATHQFTARGSMATMIPRAYFHTNTGPPLQRSF